VRRAGLTALILVGWVPALSATDAEAPSTAPALLSVTAEIRPLVRSDDSRYALSAELRMTPEKRSADGRFMLKAVNAPEAGCEIDGLFANGFE
jgi:hypothetical protein